MAQAHINKKSVYYWNFHFFLFKIASDYNWCHSRSIQGNQKLIVFHCSALHTSGDGWENGRCTTSDSKVYEWSICTESVAACCVVEVLLLLIQLCRHFSSLVRSGGGKQRVEWATTVSRSRNHSRILWHAVLAGSAGNTWQIFDQSTWIGQRKWSRQRLWQNMLIGELGGPGPIGGFTGVIASAISNATWRGQRNLRSSGMKV